MAKPKNYSIDSRTITLLPGGSLGTYPQRQDDALFNMQQPQSMMVPVSPDTLVQTTTIPTQTSQLDINYVSDVNLYSYMRGISIDIVARNLRPNRRIYVFFDGKDVGKLIQQPNIIEVDNPEIATPISNVSNGSVNINTTEEIVIDRASVDGPEVSGRSKILYVKQKGEQTFLYINHISGAQSNSSNDVATIAVINNRTGQIANVVTQRHYSGILEKSRRYLEQRPDGMSVEDMRKELMKGRAWKINDVNRVDRANTPNLVGQTITLLNGGIPGETTTIVSYNVSNGEIYLAKGFPDIMPSSNIIYTLDGVDPTLNSNNIIVIDGESVFVDNGAPDVVEAGSSTSSSTVKLYTDETGTFVGTLHIPNPIFSEDYRFRVGEKLLRISDSPTNNPDNATTIAEYVFVAFGLSLEKRQVIFSGFSTNENPLTQPTPTPPVEGSSNNPRPKRKDPTAQSFYIDPEEYPNGFFTPFIDLFFANKGTLPIEVQIRPMVNGFPSSSEILPNAVCILDANAVKVSDTPDPNNSDTYTRFVFPSPVYLSPDMEYALVVTTNDFDYDIYVSELGEKIIGSDRIVSEQPYLGSLFKSQNAKTYTPIQLEDMMFVIHKCKFDSTGTISFTENKDINYTRPVYTRTRDIDMIPVDAIELHSDAVELPGTNLTYSYRAKTLSNNAFDVSYAEFKPEKKVLFDVRKVINSPAYDTDKSFFMRIDLSTTSPDISPIVYTSKQSLGATTTLINNMGLDTSRVLIANTGNGYTRQNTSVTFTANTGQGANAKVVIKSEPFQTGKIEFLQFDSLGYGYVDNVTVNISSTDGNGAVAIVTSETDKSGGPALARYISKTVTLAPEFEAGDLRVYVTAIKPKEADVNVYYKVRNKFDVETIDDKYWVRMEKVPGISNYTVDSEPIEFEYRPSLSSNNIIYSTDNASFDTFSQYKIKIVMSSTDTVLSKIPYIYEMIAIALPADTE